MILSAVTHPKVSICIPAYNSALTLRETVESVTSQTYQDFEILLQDNASTDSTWLIMQGMATRDPRIKAVRNDTNIGMLANWNEVFKRTNAKYVLLLSSDDCLLPEFLMTCVSELEKDSTLVNVSVDHWLFWDGGQRPRNIHVQEGTYRNHADLVMLKNPFSINFTLFNRVHLDAIVSPGPPFRHFMTCDYDLHLRVALSGRPVRYIDQRLARYRLHDSNLSRQRRRITRQAALALLGHKNALASRFGIVYRFTLCRFLARALLFPLRGVDWDTRFVHLLIGRILQGTTN
jgi:glycosyltransferase involved in cell wall biosynthesis